MAAADLQAIRVALADVLRGMAGVTVAYPYEPDVPKPPCAIVGPPESFSLVSSSFGKGTLDLTFPVTLVSGAKDDRQSSRQLDDWLLSASGIWGTVLAARTLSGLVDDCVASEVRSVGFRTVGTGEAAVDLAAAEVAVRVLVRRDA